MSFIQISPDNHFPIQNLPYGVFSTSDNPRRRIGVAIGEYVLDVCEISDLFTGPVMSQRKQVLEEATLNAVMGLGREAWKEMRSTLQRILSVNEGILRDNAVLQSRCLLPQSGVTMHLPAVIDGRQRYTKMLLS